MDGAAAGYFRVSKARDGTQAPDLYREEITKYCTYKQLALAEVFFDIDFSGWRGARERPGLETLKTRRREFSCVIVPKLARFGRSVKDLVFLFDIFDRDNVALVFLDMNVDTKTSQGRLLRHVMAAFAEYESDVKSDYARANQELLAHRGMPGGGPPPFGYVAHDKSYAVDSTRAPVVKEIFDRYIAGETMNSIARDLNNRAIPSPGGARWLQGTVGVVLGRSSYAALRQFRDELLPGQWQPIVSREAWERAEELRNSTRHGDQRRRIAKQHPLLYGLIVCGSCGRKLHFRTHSAGRAYIYACPESRINALGKGKCQNGTISALRAERLVVDAFKDRLWVAFSGAAGMLKDRLTSLEEVWNGSSVQGRSDLLAAYITRVVLLERPPGQPVRGKKGRRSLEIQWRKLDSLRSSNVEKSQLPRDSMRRTCSKCHERKPVEEFPHNRSKASGSAGWCRQCSRAADRERTRRGPSYQEEWQAWLDKRIRFRGLTRSQTSPN